MLCPEVGNLPPTYASLPTAQPTCRPRPMLRLSFLRSACQVRAELACCEPCSELQKLVGASLRKCFARDLRSDSTLVRFLRVLHRRSQQATLRRPRQLYCAPST